MACCYLSSVAMLRRKRKSQLLFIPLILALFLLFQVKSQECYLEKSKCEACFIPCFEYKKENIQQQDCLQNNYFPLECVIYQKEINLTLNHSYNSNITFYYVSNYNNQIQQNQGDSCSLTKIFINKSVESLSDKFNITIATQFQSQMNDKNYNTRLNYANFNFIDIDLLIIKNIDFLGGQTQNNSVISMNNVKEAYITSCQFKNNNAILVNGTAVSATNNTQIILSNCLFINNSLNYQNDDYCVGGGAMALTLNTSAKMNHCQFIKNSIQVNYTRKDFSECKLGCGGGAIFIYNNSGIIECINCNFSKNQQSLLLKETQYYLFIKCGGGALAVQYYSNLSHFQNSSFEYNSAPFIGGAIALYDYSQILNFKYCNFTNNKVGVLNMIYNTPQQVTLYGGAIFAHSQPIISKLSNCLFQNNEAFNSSIIESSQQQYGGAIYILSSGQDNNYNILSYLDNIYFINNRAGQGGALLIHFSYENFTINNLSNLLFLNNQAQFQGGAFQLELENYDKQRKFNCQLQMNNISFINNSASKGGALYISLIDQDQYIVLLKNFIFISNNAESGGALYTQQDSIHAKLFNFSFYYNSASYVGGAIAVQYNIGYGDQKPNCRKDETNEHNQKYIFEMDYKNSVQQNIYGNQLLSNDTVSNKLLEIIAKLYFNYNMQCQKLLNTDCNFIFVQNCASQGGAVYMPKGNNLNQSFFKENYAIESGGSIFIDFAQSNFQFNDIIIQQSHAKRGGAMYLNSKNINQQQSLKFFNNMHIFECTAIQGGAIFSQQYSQLQLQKIEIYNCTADLGGALYINGSIQIEDSNNVNIYDNSALTQGSAIYQNNPINSRNSSYTGLNIQNNKIIQGLGSALYLVMSINANSYIIKLQKCEFVSNLFNKSAEQSGEINFQSITSHLTFISLYYYHSLQILNCSFYNQSSINGAAIYAYQPTNLTIQDCFFEGNSAENYGGAVYVLIKGSVEQQSQTTTSSNSLTIFVSNTIFKNNCANCKGGAIVVDFSIAAKSTIGQFINTTKLSDQITINTTSIYNNTFQDNKAVLGGSDIFINGLNQGQQQNYQLVLDLIQLLNSNNTFISNQIQVTEAQLRNNQSNILCTCLINEYLSPSQEDQLWQCQTCIKSTYQPQSPEGTLQICQPCPEGFSCDGDKYKLNVNQAYYPQDGETIIKRNQTSIAYLCDYINQNFSNQEHKVNTSICVGSQNCLHNKQCYEQQLSKEKYDANTQKWCCTNSTICLIGQIGTLCAACDYKNGFVENYSGLCTRCAQDWLIALELVFSILFIYILASLSIAGNYKKLQIFVYDKYLRLAFNHYSNINDQSVYLLKIFSNYIQNITLIVTLQIFLAQDIVDLENNMFSFITPIYKLSTSFKCLTIQLLPVKQKDLITTNQIYFLSYQIFQIVLIVVFTIFILIQKFIYFIIKKKYNSLLGTILTGAYVIFFQLQPYILHMAFLFSSSVKLGDQDYIQGDLEFESKSYNKSKPNNLLLVGAAITIQLLIPMIILFCLICGKLNKKLQCSMIISRYREYLGYFYSNYPIQCYYWDFVRMFQRILIILSFTYFAQDNVARAIAAQIIIIIYWYLTQQAKPYSDFRILKIDNFSTFAQIITILVALFLYNKKYLAVQWMAIITTAMINFSFIGVIIYFVAISYYSKFMNFMIKFSCCLKFKLFQNYEQQLKQRQKAISRWKLLRNNFKQIKQYLLNNSRDLNIYVYRQLNGGDSSSRSALSAIDDDLLLQSNNA